MKYLLGLLSYCVIVCAAQAQIDQPKEIQTSQVFGAYTIHYNVFNSTSIAPKVAQAYKLVRGAERALVNISMTKTEDGVTTLGLPAVVLGSTKNLMQQQQKLNFIEVKEGEATYYLAPFVFNNEELLHFDIQVQNAPDAEPMRVQFSRSLYRD
jgi:hypothetical protein